MSASSWPEKRICLAVIPSKIYYWHDGADDHRKSVRARRAIADLMSEGVGDPEVHHPGSNFREPATRPDWLETRRERQGSFGRLPTISLGQGRRT